MLNIMNGERLILILQYLLGKLYPLTKMANNMHSFLNITRRLYVTQGSRHLQLIGMRME